jgi:nucleoside-diphosphate-sugar epimerase
MSTEKFKVCVLFGGTGFIGTHFARHLLTIGATDQIFLADIQSPDPARWPREFQKEFRNGRVQYLNIDVRNSIHHSALPSHADLVVNLAAVHREPGHEAHEYFETNLQGAENVCAWAEKASCNTLILTSSIAPYGPTEKLKDENSIPVPISPYGASKLAAEKIHLAWQRGASDRKLLIVRPGVVFGPGEGGNVTRLVRAVLKRYFVYMGNRETRKAGGYVKELCHALVWVLGWQKAQDQGVVLFNFTMDPAPTIEEYVDTVCKVAKVKRFFFNIPYPLLLGISYSLDAFFRPLGFQHPISPVRIHKLVRSNNITPSFLRSINYKYHYTLDQAFADWQQEKVQDWT